MPAFNVDKAEILKNFKKTLTMVRGKKYTFTVDTIESDGSKHPFYLTTDAAGGSGFPGIISENVEHMYERVPEGSFETHLAKYFTFAGNFVYDAINKMYEVNGVTLADSTVRLRLDDERLRLEKGEWYILEYALQVNSGSISVNAGNTAGTPRTTSGTFTEVLQLTSSSQYRDIWIKGAPGFTGNITSLSVKQAGITKGHLVFTPSYEHPDTIYYQCGSHSSMGATINLVNQPGEVLNDLEWWYTLGINQTNRTYPPTTSSDPLIVDKLLQTGFPAGLFKNIYNLPPSGHTFTDRDYKDYYDVPNDDKTVSLSGLISDPEDDTLKYKWRHFAPKTTVAGASLLTEFDDEDSLDTTATLVEPPTDMIYTLHLEVHDSDNITTIPINIKVSGTVEFDLWDVGVSGVNTFHLGDSTVPFDDLD